MKTYADRPWLAHMDPRIDRNPILPETPVHQFLTDSFRKYPDHIALYFYGAEFTYAELESLTNKLANSLAKLGVRKGDRVALCMDNCPQYVIAFFAVLKAGAAVVQITPMATEREALYLINDSGSKGIVTLDYIWPRIKTVMNESPLAFAVVGSLYDYLPLTPFPVKPFAIPEKPLGIESAADVYEFKTLLNESCAFTPPVMNSRQDLAVLQYTSGTTGFAKGVMVTHYNLSSYVTLLMTMDYRNEPGKEIYPVTLPMSHNYAMFQTVVAPIAMGGKVVIMVRFHPDEALRVIDRLHTTIFRAVPTMLTMMIAHPRLAEFNLRSVRHWVVGGAPVPDELVAKFQQVSGANVVEGYGLTESTSGVVLNSLYDKTHKGMGFPAIMMDARVINPETGEDVPFGTDGELLLKGPAISPGYWNKPEETSKTFEGGWLHTGDIVRMSEQGVLQFVDRLKEMIIVSGFNVYPTEVENALYEHPGVMEAAVIGWPDERQGEIVKAVIVPRKDAVLKADEMISFCKERLTAYKVPKIIEVVDSLPKNPTGKIQKKALQKKV
ncbi:MAG TPA: AMP-binding protein [Smithellaceae bacterium]|nr:long-chain fatty acid--CoA ligase [Deltaproteobacteria bacterium]HPL10655.1 AMP-binding protein [Smithellaceae bacterium]HQC11604.1 AMP-binding protein [Smithellaceae bacterium]